MKKVSVIVPCHNAAKWLPQCFLSLVQQSIGIDGLELIFVDDASDDEGATWAMLEQCERVSREHHDYTAGGKSASGRRPERGARLCDGGVSCVCRCG